MTLIINSKRTKELEDIARDMRREVTELLYTAQSGHWGGSLGMADVFATLFFGGVIKYNAKKSDWQGRDRFILSNGHICPIYYVAMERAGFFGDKKPVLRKLGSPLQGHPSHPHFDFIETSTGPLGQGVGVAVGKALALKLRNAKPHVFCVTSDGEHEEGSTWEAVASAGKYGLDNLIFILDRNHVQISGKTDDISNLGDIAMHYRNIGWEVFEVDGHHIAKLLKTFSLVTKKNKKPKLILAKTVMGKGVSFIENDYRYHGRTPNKEEYEKAIAELGGSL